MQGVTNTKTILKCNCGHRVITKDVLQTGLYLNLAGPSFVYVRFRCARCKKRGEQLIQEDKWDPAVLSQSTGELGEDELRRFREMGPITADEIIGFHECLDQLDLAEEEEEAESA